MISVNLLFFFINYDTIQFHTIHVFQGITFNFNPFGPAYSTLISEMDNRVSCFNNFSCLFRKVFDKVVGN